MMKRVVVIGAGPAGLAALRSLSNHKEKLQFVAYEQSDRVGGTWIIDDVFKPTSMYTNLRTNLPKEVMAYPGFPFSSSIYESFVTHGQVLDYMQSFAQHYQLIQHIKFRHTVVEVDPVDHAGDDSHHWNVTVQDDQSGKLHTSQFDSVILCNGHYTDPLVPELNQAAYTGQIVHVHNYRSPLAYKDKTVLILGAGPSGVDIAADLCAYVKKIYLSHNQERLTSLTRDNIEQVPGIQKLSGEDIVLRDGSVIRADVILLATGYRYTFPFLSRKCHPSVQADHVRSIYRMMVDMKYPSLYYIGLNKTIVPFPQFHMQTEYAVGRITGAIKPESEEAMRQEYAETFQTRVTDKGLPDKHYHVLGEDQWRYNDQLATLCSIQPIEKSVAKLYDHVHLTRMKDLCLYKDAVYRLDGSSEQGFNIVQVACKL